jgi:RNA polymerase sigma factor (TIGR02999 family)
MDTRSVTDLLIDARHGSSDDLNRLLPLVYDDLRRIARQQLRKELTQLTVDTGALVHEAYLRLVDQTRVGWVDRAHFLAVASMAMRRVLLDHARRRRAAKRGGVLIRVPFDESSLSVEERAELLVRLDEALARLATLNERLSRVVECRYFGGLTDEETAEALNVSVRTVRRDWVKAKGWLYAEVQQDL